jgi:hypothetical protein
MTLTLRMMLATVKLQMPCPVDGQMSGGPISTPIKMFQMVWGLSDGGGYVCQFYLRMLLTHTILWLPISHLACAGS